MGVPNMSSDPKRCITCGHHKRDHSAPMGCNRCADEHQHRYLSMHQATGLIDDHPDLQQLHFEGQTVPPHIELQARLYALDMAVKAYDVYTEAEDTPDGPEWIDKAAERYLSFLMVRSYSITPSGA